MNEVVSVNDQKKVVTVVLTDYQDDLLEYLAANSFDPLINRAQLINIADKLYKNNGPLVGIATCHELDEYDYEYGYALASNRVNSQFHGVLKQGIQVIKRRLSESIKAYESAYDEIVKSQELLKGSKPVKFINTEDK